MSGPIVRTGTNPKFWANWDQAFGGGKSEDAGKKSGKAKASKAKVTKEKAPKAAAKKKSAKKVKK